MYYKIFINEQMDYETLVICNQKGKAPNYYYEPKLTKQRKEIIDYIKELIEVNIMEGETNFKQLLLMEFSCSEYNRKAFNSLSQLRRYITSKANRINPIN